MLTEYLSIWEVAHRWQNTDPNKTDPENLPFEIQDAIRYLSRLVLQGKIQLYDEIFAYPESESLKEAFSHFMVPQNIIPKEFEVAVLYRKYHSKILDCCLINRYALFKYSILTEHDFPDFWIDNDLINAFGGFATSDQNSAKSSRIEMQSLKESFNDKTVCQAIAKTLWDIYPETRIAEMTRHPSILNYGGGKKYKGKNTLPDWLREVAPENIKNKRGRPKKS